MCRGHSPDSVDGGSAVTGIVLAGGKSSRLPPDKARIVMGEYPLIQHVLNALIPCVERILIVGDRFGHSEVVSKVPLSYTDDLLSGGGPLMGLYSGLLAAETEYSAVVGCDMPLLKSELLRYLIGIAPGWDVTIPQIGGFYEPLCAVYSQRCLPQIQEDIEQGKKRMKGFFKRVEIQPVSPSRLVPYDPELHSFINVNTPAELRRAEKIHAQRRGTLSGEGEASPSS